MFPISPAQTPRRGSIIMTDYGDFGLGDAAVSKREEYVEGNLVRVAYKKDRPGSDLIDCGKEVMSIRFSPDGSVIAAGLSDGTIMIISPDTGQCMYVLSDDDTVSRKQAVTSIKFPPMQPGGKVEHSHYLMATYASGLVKLWHYTSPGQTPALYTLNEVRQTLAGTYNPDGSMFLTSGEDPQLILYDTETHKRVRVLEPSDSRDVMNGHRARVFAVQYHPLRPHVFITGGWDDTVQFWDDRQKRATRKLFGPHICGDGIDIDSANDHILTASWRKDNTLQIWDFGTGDKIKDIPQDPLHKSLLYCGQWLGRDNIVCGGCENNMVRIIDRGTLNTVGQLVNLSSGVFCLDNDRHNKPRIAVGSATKIWLLKLEKKHT